MAITEMSQMAMTEINQINRNGNAIKNDIETMETNIPTQSTKRQVHRQRSNILIRPIALMPNYLVLLFHA